MVMCGAMFFADINLQGVYDGLSIKDTNVFIDQK